MTDKNGTDSGFVTIESVWRMDEATVGVQLNIVTSAKGAQTFALNYPCRCQPNANWSKGAVTVSFGV